PTNTIHPATLSDLPAIANLVHASKQHLPINHVLFKDWPNEAGQKPIYTAAVEGAFKNPDVESFKVVDDASGEVVGEFVLSRKKPGLKGNADADADAGGTKGEGGDGTGGGVGGVQAPDGMVPELYHLIVKRCANLANVMKDTDHFEITHIFLIPSARKHGIGSRLIQMAKQRAKEAGVALWVVAEPETRSFFDKMGFEEMDHADFDLTEWAAEKSGYGLFRLSGML
ncbi:acyl-CoA N-acyltransferase, partial [Aulographum hederae CBS 113979]